MRLPDGTVLMHNNVPYDPVKAHAYYLRNRKLHPRQKRETFSIVNSSGHTVTLTPKQLAQQQAYAHHRVATITAKLQKLNQELRKKIDAAAKREFNATKPQTAADKAKAARQAKQYRDKNKTKLANQRKQNSSSSGGSSSGSSSSTSSKKGTSVASLKKEIVNTKNRLKAAVARERELGAAKKNG